MDEKSEAEVLALVQEMASELNQWFDRMDEKFVSITGTLDSIHGTLGSIARKLDSIDEN